MSDQCCHVKLNSQSAENYWDETFASAQTLAWEESDIPWVMDWVLQLNLEKNARIFCAGVGNSRIVDHLLKAGFTNIVANDISGVALDTITKRVNSNDVTYVQDDLIKGRHLKSLENTVDLYIDRATLHFFTQCEEKDAYFAQMNRLLAPEGITVIGVFDKNNEPVCCGQQLQLWSLESLKNRLKEFSFLAEAHETFYESNGSVRNYIYLQAQKT